MMQNHGRLEWPDPTPDGPTKEEELEMQREAECQTCDGNGRIEVFRCDGVCQCGMCPELEDCPECCGHEPPDAPMNFSNEAELQRQVSSSKRYKKL